MFDIDGFQDDRIQLELYFACENIKNMNSNINKMNFQIQLFSKLNNTQTWNLVATTDLISNNINPIFSNSITINYIFEEQQHLKIHLVNYDDNKKFVSVYGEAITTLGKIVGSRNQILILDLNNFDGVKISELSIQYEKQINTYEYVCLKLSGKNIYNTRWLPFSYTNPFLRFYKIREENKDKGLCVYQTEFIQNDLNPSWMAFEINLGKFCNNDYYSPINVHLLDHYSCNQVVLIGETQIKINDLQQNKVSFKFKNPNNMNKESGELIIDKFKINISYNFLDFIHSGTQLSLIAAIDFTASNGDPKELSSLHYIDQNDKFKLNQYQSVLLSCTEILINYDYDKMIPVYGFGGKPFGEQKVNHFFSLNGDYENPDCFNIEGIMEAYTKSLYSTKLSGPTLFFPLISKIMSKCDQSKRNNDNQYYILLILTDGQIHDMEETKRAIVDCAYLPLSIIIIGIGNEDFSNMTVLDGDNGLVDNQGRKAVRDLVQFVPFNAFKNKEELSLHVLEELPCQLIEYMKLVGKMP